MLNGKVTPREAPIDKAGSASGTAIRIAAGAAMYEQLAYSTANNIVPPSDKPKIQPKYAPKRPAVNGKRMPKATMKIPLSMTDFKRDAASNPISSKKNANTPMNKSMNILSNGETNLTIPA